MVAGPLMSRPWVNYTHTHTQALVQSRRGCSCSVSATSKVFPTSSTRLRPLLYISWFVLLAMDSGAVKLLLESQERTFRSALDVVAEQFRSGISAMEVTISELTKSLEFSQADVQDLKKEADHLRKCNSDNQAKIQEHVRKIEDMEQRLNYQEDYSRRNNLRISGQGELQTNEM